MNPRSQLLSEVRTALLSAEPQAHRAAVLALLEQGESVFDRTHYEPGHFTASGFVVCPEGRRLLLIRHRKLGLWLQPGGHIEPEDLDLTQAALREVKEETGLAELELLDPWFDLDVHSIPAWSSVPQHLHHDVRVLLRASSLDVHVGEDVDDVVWFELEQVASSTGELFQGLATDESVRRVARRLLELAARRA